MSTSRVLLVEDEPEVAELLSEFFSNEGFQVETVGNGLLALAKLARHVYDVIVCDIVMPGLDGPGLYWEVIQQRPDLAQRFVFISGFGDTEAAEPIRHTTAPILSKPFRLAQIRAAIKQVLEEAVVSIAHR